MTEERGDKANVQFTIDKNTFMQIYMENKNYMAKKEGDKTRRNHKHIVLRT